MMLLYVIIDCYCIFTVCIFAVEFSAYILCGLCLKILVTYLTARDSTVLVHGVL